MTRLCLYIALLIPLALPYAGAWAQSHTHEHEHPTKTYSEPFRSNDGQWDEHIKFRADLPDGFLWLESNRFTYSFFDGKALSDIHAKSIPEGETFPEHLDAHAFRVNFVGSNPDPVMEKEKRSRDYINYFLGNDKSRWKSKVYAYGLVRYKELYDHTDLTIYQQQGALKYDYVVHPGGNPKDIRMDYDGADKMEVRHGNLYITTSVNEVIENRPYAYQIIRGKRRNVPCSFKLDGETLTFKFPAGYNKKYPLIIDPLLIFGSYTGSSLNNFGFTATYDLSGNLYGGGIVFTGTGTYPTNTGAFQISHAGGTIDMGISKFNDNGTALLYSTLIGGTQNESPHSMVVNSNDELIIFGTTSSSDFPMLGTSYDGSFAGGNSIASMNGYGYGHSTGTDIVLAKLSADGSSLIGATFVGGTGNDGLILVDSLDFNYGDTFRGEVIVDDNDNIYVSSTTASQDFPLANPAQPIYGGGARDAVVFKFNPNLSTLLFSTYLGGSRNDAGYGIQLSTTGDIYAVGGTGSYDFPIPNGGLNPNYLGNIDGYIARYAGTGGAMIDGTFIGTSNHDQTYFVQLDDNNQVYVVGQCRGSYPVGTTLGQGMYTNSGSKQFLHKLTTDLSSTVWSTVIGSGSDKVDFSLSAFLVNQCDHIYISGWSGATNMVNRGFWSPNAANTNSLPTTNDATQSSTDGSDFYLIVLSEEAQYLLYATYYGGSISNEHVDGGTSRFDKSGKVYQAVCAGCGGFDDFPTTSGSVSQTNGSSCNLGVFKYDLAQLTSNVNIGLPYICIPGTMTFQNLSNGGTNFYWDFGDGNTSNDFQPTHTYTDTGTFTITLIVSDSLSCVLTDTAFATISAYAPNNAGITPVDTICPEDSLFMQASGGITYQWIPTTGLSNPNSANTWASPGQTTNYMLLTTDSCGTDTAYTTVVVFIPTSTTSPDTNICIGQSVPIWATGGVSYSWTPASTLVGANTANPTATPTITTTYYVDIITPQGCLHQDSVTVTVDTSLPNPQLHPDTTICSGDAIQLWATGASSYVWSPDATLNANNVANPWANPLITTTYTVDFINGCGIIQDQVTVSVQTATANASPDQWICIGDTAFIWATGGVSYAWSPALSLTHPDSSFTGSVPPYDQTYSVVVTDALGCTDTAHTTVNYYPIPPVDAGPGGIVIYGSSMTLSGSGFGTLVWDTTATISCTQCLNPIVSPTQTTTYYVTITDVNGCTNVDSVTVIVDGALYVPNTFTPDGDGINDFFFAQGKEITEFEMLIFNRWGELIYEMDDLNDAWDGTYGGEPAQIDVYVWKLKYSETSGEHGEFYGHVNLLR